MATRLMTAIESGSRAPSRRLRLGPVAIELSPAQFQPVIQKAKRAIHEAGGRRAASASGVPCSAPTTFSQPPTLAAPSGGGRRESPSATSAPHLLALPRIRAPPRRPPPPTPP